MFKCDFINTLGYAQGIMSGAFMMGFVSIKPEKFKSNNIENLKYMMVSKRNTKRISLEEYKIYPIDHIEEI